MELMFRRAVFDHDVLALDEARFLQALTEGGHEVHSVSERGVPHEPDYRHLRLLRARRERPRSGRTAEERDELAASHCGYFFTVSRNFIQAAIPARADFSSTPSGNPATPTPPTSWPSTASGTPPPTR